MVAREERLLLAQREAHVIGHVARREDGIERPARPRQRLAIPQAFVGRKSVVDSGIEAKRVPGCRFGGAEGEHGGAGLRLETCRERRVVGMRMRHQHMGDGFAAQGVAQGGKMGRIVGSRIDDGDAAAADDELDVPVKVKALGLLQRMRRTSGVSCSASPGAALSLRSKSSAVMRRCSG